MQIRVLLHLVLGAARLALRRRPLRLRRRSLRRRRLRLHRRSLRRRRRSLRRRRRLEIHACLMMRENALCKQLTLANLLTCAQLAAKVA